MNNKRRALIVGIDEYDNVGNLSSPTKDARAVKRLLARNEDKTLNYECRLWEGTTPSGERISRPVLRRGLEDLFGSFRGDVLFYFAGHGSIGALGGHLVTQEGQPGDWGISMDEVLRMAMHSEANDILIILDCCHSGDLADLHFLPRAAGARNLSALREDMTVMAASMPQESAYEGFGHGRFTEALLAALDGGAADPMGWITASSIYSSIERRFGAWPQQPVYKSHSTRATVVRKAAPLIDLRKIHRLTKVFDDLESQPHLDPGHEKLDKNLNQLENPDPKKVKRMALLRSYLAAGLIRPVEPKEYLYDTALKSHAIQLTARGKELWTLVKHKKI